MTRPKMLFALLALLATLGLSAVSATAASASLSRVGPTLPWGDVPGGKSLVKTMVTEDQGVQLFIKNQTSGRVTMKSLEAATISSLKYTTCVVGRSKSCAYNTGKSGWKLVKTSYRWGHTRQVALCVITLKSGKSFKLTVHVLSSNLMFVQHERKLKHKPKRLKVTAKPIIIKKVKVATPVVINVCQSHHNVNNGIGNAGSCNVTNVVGITNVTYITCSDVNGNGQYYMVQQGENCNSVTAQPCNCVPPPPPPCQVNCQPPPPPPPCCVQQPGKDGTDGPTTTPDGNGGAGSGGTGVGTSTGNSSTHTLGECQYRDGNDTLQLGYLQSDGVTCGPNPPA